MADKKTSIFGNAFNTAFGGVEESVLDYPNGKGLCSDIWDKDGKTYILKKSISQKIKEVSEYIKEQMGLKNAIPRLVGSICSNSYGKKSDIDIHFEVEGMENKDEDYMKDLNKEMEDLFNKKYENLHFNSHPVECFIQNHPFQDNASVGSYDIDTDKWIVEPQILDLDFDPYDEYFDSSMKLIDEDGLFDSIKKIIFEAGINARAYLNVIENGNKNIKKELEDNIDECIDSSKELFKKIRHIRMVNSLPKTNEEAKKMRKSKEWKTKDAAFKFMDKMGFLASLKEIRNSKRECKTYKEKAIYILDGIKSNLFGEDIRVGSYGR